jgi:multidrug efflux system membrane fusion protein
VQTPLIQAVHTRPIRTRARTFGRYAFTFFASLVLAACSRTAAQQASPPPPQVTVAEVLDREVTEWDEFTGRLEAVDTVSVRPRVSGYVSSLHFNEGALVGRGQLLFQIDPRPFQAEVDRLRAELTRARATVQRADSELRRAERLQAENAMSHEEHDRRAAFAQESSAQVSAVEAALRAAELNLEFTHVTSPIAGRAGRAVVTAGNLVSSGPGEATLLATVVSIDPIYAYFNADEQIYLRYEQAARRERRRTAHETSWPIRMALATDEGFPREGRMDFLDNQLDPQAGTIRGRAVFKNGDGALTPGLFVRLRLAGGGRYRGLLVQDRAVGTDLGRKFVLVVNAEQTIEYRTVTLGPLIDGLRVVQSGLQPHDRVVINGLQRVRPGVKVSPVIAEMEAAPAAAGVAERSANAQ